MEILHFTEQHEAYRNRFQDFLQKVVTPFIDDWERDHMHPKSVWKKMGAAGFLCPWVATEYGGMGGDLLYSMVINRELARTNHTGLIVYLHSDIVVPYLATFGTEAQKKKFLPGCITGDVIMAVAMTEPDTGSDIAAITTTAVEEGDEVVINGSKTFISIGQNCDLVVVAARDPSVANPYQALSLYLVEDGTPGFSKGNKIDKMGMHSQDTSELFFHNCRIPLSNRLGEKGQGFLQLMQKLQQERLMVALQAVDSAEFALDWIVDRCKHPPAASADLLQSQAVQFALAEMATEVKIGKTFVYKLIADHMEKKDVVQETSMAKYWTTDLLKRTVGRGLDLIGAEGTRESCPIVRTWRDAQIYSIFAGTNEIMKTIIAKQMFK
ncbi:acyl-CoA dehydrogenase family protein [bacterium]|nr:acyl-CoA dehydrogenase family protein [bacterium]